MPSGRGRSISLKAASAQPGSRGGEHLRFESANLTHCMIDGEPREDRLSELRTEGMASVLAVPIIMKSLLSDIREAEGLVSQSELLNCRRIVDFRPSPIDPPFSMQQIAPHLFTDIAIFLLANVSRQGLPRRDTSKNKCRFANQA